MERVKIGWARREFSLDEPVQIPGQGYMRVSEGIMDPLYATALAIDGGEGQGTVIFLSIDHIAVRFIQPIRELIKEKDPTVPVDTLVMNATHTHTGMVLDKTVEKTPDGAPIYPGEKACEHYKQQASDAVVAAWRARKPGGIAYGYGYAVVGHSRRVTYMEDIGKDDPLAMAPNGTAAMYGSTKDKRFAGYEAGADHFLNCLYTFDEDDRLTGMILNVPCPSQVSEQLTRLSADYWGDVREQMKDVFGPDVYLLQQCGAAGDTSPRILHYRAAQERRMRLKYGVEYNYKKCVRGSEDLAVRCAVERKDIAERIVKGAKEVYDWAKKDIRHEIPVLHKMREVPLKMRKVTPEEAEECRRKIADLENYIPAEDNPDYRYAMSRINSLRARNQRVIERFNEQGDDPRLEFELHTVAIGDVAFCTNRFELYQDYMHRIQARSPFLQTFVMQLAGDSLGSYLPTKRGEEGKGYSASVYDNRVGSEGGQQLVEETLKLLNELKEEEEK